MTLTQEAVEALVGSKKDMGMTSKELEDYFKEAFKAEMISIDLYTMAIAELYSSETKPKKRKEKEMNQEDLNKAFVQQLKNARIQKGISVIEVAKRAGWKRSNVYRIESGEINLSTNTIIEYLGAIGCKLTISDEKSLVPMDDTKAQAIINKLSDLQNTLAKLTAEANAIAAEINEIVSHTSEPERFPEEEQIGGGDFDADNDIDI